MTLTYQKIRQHLIGENQTMNTPFGMKPIVYADYTASGRSLAFIEDFIRSKVLPYYANTHTESSFTGRQTSALREQSRQIIRQAIGANEDHNIIFCGSGATAAIDKIIGLLGLRSTNTSDQAETSVFDEQRPVIFIGAYEHHSNELPWRETIAKVIAIPLLDNGSLDLDYLKTQLQAHEHSPLKIGSFSAASNVTGMKTDIKTVAKLLHRYGALALADYAAAAPYMAIDMQGDEGEDNGLDGVFISPHKFVGGPGTCGVLAVHKRLNKNSIPVVQGGGTVSYVTSERHTYLQNVERREEAGTPGIVESIRTGLVFKVQQDIGIENIEYQEAQYSQRALKHWSENPNIHVLGNTSAERLAITSLQIFHQEKELHYGFVVALLNDLFGIQARGGCSCAGPYGHILLKLSDSRTEQIEQRVVNGATIFRPGWVRMNFNYFISESQFQYLLDAIDLIAESGWKLVPYYQYDAHLGVWLFQGDRPELPVSLFSSSYLQDNVLGDLESEPDYVQLLEQAKQQLHSSREDQLQFNLPEEIDNDDFYWFYKPVSKHEG
ncbi:MAG: aminotransferase class V-fold PLP-dependent enzyme [Arenicella sp.]